MQMLEAEAVPLLVGMLGGQPAAADLLCFMATQQQCNDTFLGGKAVGSLVDCLHGSGSSGTVLLNAAWVRILGLRVYDLGSRFEILLSIFLVI